MLSLNTLLLYVGAMIIDLQKKNCISLLATLSLHRCDKQSYDNVMSWIELNSAAL